MSKRDTKSKSSGSGLKPSQRMKKNKVDLDSIFTSNDINYLMQLNKINFNLSHYKDCQVVLDDLKKKLSEVESIRKDKGNFIYEYFSDITREVDLRRDTLFRDITEYSNKIIENINKLRQECLDSSSRQLKAAEGVLDTCKLEVNEQKDKFDSFEIYDKKFEEVLSKSKVLQGELGLAMNKYKFGLQGNKSYRLGSKKIKISKVFGSIETFNLKNNFSVKVIQF